jgi:Gpi18-like mannosyltransferase
VDIKKTEESRLTLIEKFENQLNILSKYPFLSLFLIGIGAILIRLVFFQNELIFSGDNLSYFKYAIDISLTGESPFAMYIQNNGWPLFVSVFFNVLNSDNVLDYMNLQSILSIIISVITIIPLYFLAKKFTNSSFALLTTILFIFEPRIIANSLIGVTDPLFILLIVTSLALIVQKNKFIIYGACITIGLACVVRSEGLFLIPALFIMFLIKNKITKINIAQCIIFIIIIYLILLPFSMQRIESTGNDFLVGRIIDSSSLFLEQTDGDQNQIFSKIGESFYIFGGFLGRLMIPYLGIFVPLGIILFLKGKNIQKSLLIIPGFFMILPSLYAYTVPALDSRYLFPILPILCIFGTFACMKFIENRKYKKIIITTIIIIVIVSSSLFLNYKDINIEKEKEFIELANIVNNNTDIILFINSPIFTYLDVASLLELKEFPVISSDYDKNSTRSISLDFNVVDFFPNMKKLGITHIVIDEEIDNSMIIKEIFKNYEENKNLKKIFDSQENGFNYKIKIFEINYN